MCIKVQKKWVKSSPPEYTSCYGLQGKLLAITTAAISSVRREASCQDQGEEE